MSSDSSQLLNSCPVCQNAVDVTECEPYAKVNCPHCSESIRVRRQFHQFLIDGEIGRGGLSRVFRATDQSLGRSVALKILQAKFLLDDDRIAQFEREARVMASVTHPNIVKLFSVGHDQGYFYIAMELVERGSFDQMLTKQGKLPENLVLQWGAQIARGLEAAHEDGVIHRDIKPGNIMLADNNTAKIVDFGLALIYARERDVSGEVWATPYYVAPEKLFGQPEDFRSDVYSLGAMLFHCATGYPPYDVKTNSMEELRRIKSRPVSARVVAPDLSEMTGVVIDRMLAFQPEDRQASYAELIGDLEFASDSLGPHKGGGTSMERAQRRPRRIAWAVAGSLVLAAAAGGWAWRQGLSKSPVAAGTLGLTSEEDLGHNVSGPFLEARRQLVEGQFAQAARLFQGVHQNEASPQPTKSWAIFLHGLSQLLGGEETASQATFSKLLAQSDFSPEKALWRDFFAACGTRLARDEAIPVAAMETGTDSSPRCVALLAFGIKNWQRKRFAEAKPFLETFAHRDLGAAASWVGALQNQAENYLQDLSLLEKIPARAQEDLPTLERAAKELREAKLLTGAPASAEMATALAALESRLATLAEQQKKSRRQETDRLAATELDKLIQTTRQSASFGPQLRFREGLVELDKIACESPPGQEARADLRWLWQSANDLLASADGPKPSAEEWIKHAQALLARTRESNLYYLRKAQFAAFAERVGQRELCEQLAAELSQENRAFRERWARLQKLTSPQQATSHER